MPKIGGGGWNYRVLRSQDPDGTTVYEIREVFYTEDGHPDGNCAATPLSEDRVGLLQVLAMMCDAIKKPTLDRATLDEVEPETVFSDQLSIALARVHSDDDLDALRVADSVGSA